MQRVLPLVAIVTPLLLGVASCQLVAGTGSRHLDPIYDANTLPGLEGGGPPSLGNGRIRIANLAVTSGNVDFCVKLSSSTSWGDPIMANAGGDPFFKGGLSYPMVTVPFSAPVGNIDVKFIPIGSLCSVPALSEGDGIAVGDNSSGGDATVSGGSPVVTILRYGGYVGGGGDAGIPETVVGLPEEIDDDDNPTCKSNVCPRFRIVNAAATQTAINFGQTDEGARTLPATVSNDLALNPIAPGSVAAPQPQHAPVNAADSSGYFGTINSGTSGGAGVTLGIVQDDAKGNPSKNAVAIFSPSSVPDTQTLYFIGDPANNTHPLQGLLVEDTAAAGTGPDGGVDTQFLAKAQLTTPLTISIDTWNPSLYGLQVGYIKDRTNAIEATVAKRSTDVICFAEMDYDSDKKAIADAGATGNYPYSYFVPTRLTTAPSNSADWYGNVPAPINAAPCAAAYDAGILTDPSPNTGLLGCAEECSISGNNSPDAGISSLSCLENYCTNIALGIIDSDGGASCVDCVVGYLNSMDSIDTMIDQCGTNIHDPYGQYSWDGQNGSMILSHFPFAKDSKGKPMTDAFIFPGSNYRRVILHARLQLDANDQLDVFCGQFVSPDTGSTVLTYSGDYATPDAGLYAGESDDPGATGWRDEDSLQARYAIEFIKAKAGKRPAIAAGYWETAAQMGDAGGKPILAAHDIEVYDRLLAGGLVPAEPAGYTPDCSTCNDNPLQGSVTTDGTIGYDITTTFLYNFPEASTLSETWWDRTPDQWVVPEDAGTPSGKIPMSGVYPHNVVVLRPAGLTSGSTAGADAGADSGS